MVILFTTIAKKAKRYKSFKSFLTTMINKYTIDTMMNTQLLHSLISKPAGTPAMVAYWFDITRGESNQALGGHRI